jgi:hypothetical protein
MDLNHFFIYIFTGAPQSAHEAPLVPGVHMHGLLHRSRPRTATGKFELAFCRSNLRRQSEEKMNTEVASLWLRPSSIPIPLWPVCIYNYVYLFNLRHTSPVIEREISSGGAVGRFGNEPAQAPRLVFLDGGVIFESLVGAGVGMP